MATTPSNLRVTDFDGVSISLAWDDVSDETEYRIYRAQSIGGGDLSNYTQIDTTGQNVTTYDDTGLLNGVEYYYVVTSYDGSAESGASNEVSEITTVPAIDDLATPDVRETEADLSWSNPENNATAKRVYVRRTGSDDSDEYERTGMEFSQGDNIEFAKNLLKNPGDFTVAWRMRTTSTEGQVSHLSKRAVCSASDFIDIRGSAARPEMTIYNDNSVSVSIDVNDGNWHSVIFGRGSELYSFVDGGDKSTNTSSGGLIDDDVPLGVSTSPCIGADATVGYSGDMAEIIVYHRSITDQEAADIANGNPPTDYVAYYPLDLNRSGVTPDLSPYANHGTVNGPTLTGPSVQEKSVLSASATSDTVTGLLNGEEYEAYIHTVTEDNEVRDI